LEIAARPRISWSIFSTLTLAAIHLFNAE
jgi:hypothetical protein